LLILLGYIGLYSFGHLAFLVYHNAVKSLDGSGAKSVPATVRVVVVVKRGKTFSSSPFVLRDIGWGDLPSAFRDLGWGDLPSAFRD
jgi:hypothetical protein